MMLRIYRKRISFVLVAVYFACMIQYAITGNSDEQSSSETEQENSSVMSEGQAAEKQMPRQKSLFEELQEAEEASLRRRNNLEEQKIEANTSTQQEDIEEEESLNSNKKVVPEDAALNTTEETNPEVPSASANIKINAEVDAEDEREEPSEFESGDFVVVPKVAKKDEDALEHRYSESKVEIKALKDLGLLISSILKGERARELSPDVIYYNNTSTDMNRYTYEYLILENVFKTNTFEMIKNINSVIENIDIKYMGESSDQRSINKKIQRESTPFIKNLALMFTKIADVEKVRTYLMRASADEDSFKENVRNSSELDEAFTSLIKAVFYTEREVVRTVRSYLKKYRALVRTNALSGSETFQNKPAKKELLEDVFDQMRKDLSVLVSSIEIVTQFKNSNTEEAIYPVVKQEAAIYFNEVAEHFNSIKILFNEIIEAEACNPELAGSVEYLCAGSKAIRLNIPKYGQKIVGYVDKYYEWNDHVELIEDVREESKLVQNFIYNGQIKRFTMIIENFMINLPNNHNGIENEIDCYTKAMDSLRESHATDPERESFTDRLLDISKAALDEYYASLESYAKEMDPIGGTHDRFLPQSSDNHFSIITNLHKEIPSMFEIVEKIRNLYMWCLMLQVQTERIRIRTYISLLDLH
ncbi:hypothetical protein NECID01_1615 [Nematocida sp. AWRm77]|nr:hypothetical protein NECID01_1615 [Nematocida sp. AWRm77]